MSILNADNCHSSLFWRQAEANVRELSFSGLEASQALTYARHPCIANNAAPFAMLAATKETGHNYPPKFQKATNNPDS